MKKLNLDIQRFSSTNKTTNYELPQFIGTDKPTWLGDINEAMADIDAGMHENATAISTMASDVATASATASQASQDVSALTSTVNTLSTNVQTATTTANNAQSTATSALNTANTANGKADTNASNIATNTSDIASIESDITTINSNITNIHNDLDHLKDYSSNEAIIGTWIDGKPLYRTIFNYGQLPNNSTVGKNHNIPIDTPVLAYGVVKTSSGTFNTWTIPSTNIFVDLSHTGVYIQTDSDRSNLNGIIVIEYTKTTDQAS